MSVTEYTAIRASINQLDKFVMQAVQDGWQPVGSIWTEYGQAAQVMVKEDSPNGTTTDYKVVRAPIGQLDKFVSLAISDGWQPVGTMAQSFSEAFQAMKKGTGTTGEIGPKGDKGDQGLKGDAGPKGDTGPKGDKGEAGLKGATGEPGTDGTDGAKGDAGAKGAKGDTGPKGDTGATPSLAVTADEASGLAAAANLQVLAEALSARIKAIEDKP